MIDEEKSLEYCHLVIIKRHPFVFLGIPPILQWQGRWKGPTLE